MRWYALTQAIMAANNYTVSASLGGTLTVNNPSTGGGSGGSSGGSSGGTASTTIESNVPASTINGSINATVTVKDNTAAIGMTDAQMKEIAANTEKVGTTRLDVSELKVDAVVIPAKIISAVADSTGSMGFELVLPAGIVTLDKAALAAVAGKGDVKLSVETVGNDKLTDAQKAALGTQAGSAVVVDVNIDVNGIKTGTFDGGKLAIAFHIH